MRPQVLCPYNTAHVLSDTCATSNEHIGLEKGHSVPYLYNKRKIDSHTASTILPRLLLDDDCITRLKLSNKLANIRPHYLFPS